MITEPQAKIEFESFVPPSLFSVAREVVGEFGPTKPIKQLFRSWGNITKERLRIDYVLTPTQTLLDAGWELGSIGVEVKVGKFGPPYDKRIGRVISQIFDYQSALFALSGKPPAALSMVFLFVRPYDAFGSLPASVMMQEGIGLVKGGIKWEDSFTLVHGNGMHPILEIIDSHPVYRRPRFGMGAGSR